MFIFFFVGVFDVIAAILNLEHKSISSLDGFQCLHLFPFFRKPHNFGHNLFLDVVLDFSELAIEDYAVVLPD